MRSLRDNKYVDTRSEEADYSALLNSMLNRKG